MSVKDDRSWEEVRDLSEAELRVRRKCPDRYILLDYCVKSLGDFKSWVDAGHLDRWRVEATAQEDGIAYVILSKPSEDQTRYDR